MSNPTQRISQTVAQIEKYGFGVADKYGREIGLIVSTYEAEYAERTDGGTSGWAIAPGRYFVARCQAARNGESYGASQGGHHCTTEEERDAYIAKRIAASRKQAAKKAA